MFEPASHTCYDIKAVRLFRAHLAKELASLGDSSEPANRRPAPGVGSAPLPAVTSEHSAFCSRHLVSPEGGDIYAAVLAGSVAPLQPSESLKPTAMDSEPSECAVSSETLNRPMSSDMSGPLSDKPEGTTPNAQVTNTCLSAGERPNKTTVLISGARDVSFSLGVTLHFKLSDRRFVFTWRHATV